MNNDIKSDSDSEDSNSSTKTIQSPKPLRMSLIGNIEPFTFDGQSDLNEYLIRMEHIFKINKVEEELKISFLISIAGKEFHERVNVVIKPKELKDFTYTQLTSLIKSNFKPVKNIRAERFKFLSRVMNDSESIEDFAVEIKNLANTCEYGDFLETMLGDKLILSIRDSTIQKRLMEEPLSKSFAEICEKALTLELTSKDVELMQQHSTPSNVAWVAKRNQFRVTGRSDYNQRNRPMSSRMMMDYDMKKHKNIKREPFTKKDITCYRCNRKGHYAYECFEKEREKEWGDRKTESYQRNHERKQERKNRRLR